jgi:hypothetical protein
MFVTISLIIATAVLALLFYRSRLPAFFYCAIGGAAVLCEAGISALGFSTDILLYMGFLFLGWGFARAVTVDRQRLHQMNVCSVLLGIHFKVARPESSLADVKGVELRDTLVNSAILLCSGLILSVFQFFGSTVGYIFILLGIQILIAHFVYFGLPRQLGGEEQGSG